MTSTIVGLSVAAFVAVLLAAGAYYVCVHKQCLSWSNRVRCIARLHCDSTLTVSSELVLPCCSSICNGGSLDSSYISRTTLKALICSP